jgi:intracellular septation protein
MKLLFDFLPIILFFGTFKYAEAEKDWAADFATTHLGFMVSGGKVSEAEAPVLLATVVVIAATLAQVAWLKLRRRRVDTMLWVSLALVVVLGGLTIWLHSETFIKWKPSALYWAMGLAFWLSPLLFKRNLLKVLLGEQLVLPGKVWHRLNFAWIAFFGVMGLLNIWVAYTFTTATWVNFKLFGGLGLMLLFMLAQGLWISRYLEPQADDMPPPQDQPAGEPR